MNKKYKQTVIKKTNIENYGVQTNTFKECRFSNKEGCNTTFGK